MKSLPIFLCFGLPTLGLLGGQTWTMTAPRAWSRTLGAARLKVHEGGVLELRHVGEQDWSIHGMKPIAVRGGDAFRISCVSEAVADGSQRGLSPQLFDDSGQFPAKAGEVLAEGGKWMLKTWRAFGGSCH